MLRGYKWQMGEAIAVVELQAASGLEARSAVLVGKLGVGAESGCH
jgi:hypothetical protein